jgi:hypothetical protein
MLNAQRCYDFLDTVLPWQLEVLPLAVNLSLWFLHDSVPVHCGKLFVIGLTERVEQGELATRAF